MADYERRYERIDLELPCRLFIPEERGDGLRFESFNVSINLGLGGVFLQSTFLLKTGRELFVELHLPSGPLAIRSRIAHTVGLDHRELPSGMGVEFLDVDSHGREALLRYFTPERYHRFYAALSEEFPHLKKDHSLEDVSLIVNLWEEFQVMAGGGPAATASGAPKPGPKRRR